MLKKPSHFLALDGLRGIAALMVLSGHLEMPFFHPAHFELAVDFFFLLSGFVIANAYEQRLRDGMGFLDFFFVRVVRLYPLVLLSVLIGAAILFARAGLGHDARFWGVGVVSLGLALLVMPSPLLQYTVGDGAFPFNVPTWSLFVEFIVNFAYARFGWRLNDRGLALFTALAAVALLVSGANGGSTWQTLYGGFARALFSFPAGVLIFRLWAKGVRPKISLPPWLLVVAMASCFFIPRNSLATIGEFTCIFLIFPAILFLSTSAKLSGAWKSAAVIAGRLSYPLYILHHPLLKPFANIARSRHFDGLSLKAWFALEIILVIAFAFLVMKFYDDPVRQKLAALVSRHKSRLATGSA